LASGFGVIQGNCKGHHLKAWIRFAMHISLATMAASLAVFEIFSVKEWHDIENWVTGCSRSLKMSC